MNWEEISLDEARARADGRRVALKVGASWCSMCHDLDRTVIDTAAGRALFADLVCVRVDHDGPLGRPIVERFAVLELPTLIVLDGEVEVGRVLGYRTASKWIEEARAAIAASDPLPVLRAAHESAPDDPKTTLALGEALLSRAPDEGLALLERVTFTDGEEAAFALWLLGRYHQRVLADPNVARFIWQQLAECFPESPHARDALFWYAKAQAARGRPELGSAIFAAHVARDPKDAITVAQWARFCGRVGYEPARAAIREAAMKALASARGDARDDLEDLVMSLGAPFTPEE